ncbi:MAG: sterol desaturase family protein [Bacteroidetes bacterium]|jgi:beta-carotene 3-hydroxylase|nr:sterol desaturase family protein [Bacteroidota bacterium]
MERILLGTLLLIATAVGMEALAWLIHRYLLHGPLWFVHRTHHRPQRGFWEWNDLVALFYAALSAGLVVLGLPTLGLPFWVGLGIALYGLLYFWLHDLIIHQRIRVRYRTRWRYLQRLIRAHKIHHKQLNARPAEAYGFLYAPRRYQPSGPGAAKH